MISSAFLAELGGNIIDRSHILKRAIIFGCCDVVFDLARFRGGEKPIENLRSDVAF